MQPRLADALARHAGSPIVSVRRLGGGDVNEAFAVVLGDGRRLFVKTQQRPPADLFAREAEGLAWLDAAGALRVPRVIDIGAAEPAYLALEYIETGSPGPAHDEALGRGLAALHAAGAPAFGFARGNFIGPIPQDNRPCESWAQFYAERRLLPLLRRAIDAGRAPGAWTARVERLCTRLPRLAGAAEPPARLHGDLWSGNVLTDERGLPVLIDPAVYGGHREVDLAMLRLFGSPSPRVFAAYDEAFPLAPDSAGRVALYQLYPLLVHVHLFGGGYAASFDAALRRYD